ncbi:Zf-HC2 domain-containing protein OS=Streptomyces alboniger OX=132473 GN=CP975_31850 PE=4 SV=1 [Streptomyces alboniger]
MRPLERHRDAWRYALGVLDAADAFRFEDHLEEVPRLSPRPRRTARRRAAVVGVRPGAARRGGGLAPGRHAGSRTASSANSDGSAGPGAGGGWCAAAVAVVLAVGAPAAAVATADGPGAARDGVTASLAAHDRAWGTEIDLTVRDPAPGHGVCELVAVGKDGSERTVTTWRAKGRTVRTRGVSDLGTAATDHYEVRTAEGRPADDAAAVRGREGVRGRKGVRGREWP